LLTASATVGNISCNGGTTTVTVSGSGGTSPYQGTGSFTRGAGPYTYTITDANGCTATAGGNISQPSAVAVTATPGTIACNGGTTTVVVSATGGTSPYTGTGSLTAQSAGSNTYTVTDNSGCTGSVTISIPQPTSISVTGTRDLNNCTLNTPAYNFNAVGGTPPYTGSTSFNGAGDCTYTVTDSNGCTGSTTVNH
jgi:hypothetical protein